MTIPYEPCKWEAGCKTDLTGHITYILISTAFSTGLGLIVIAFGVINWGGLMETLRNVTGVLKCHCSINIPDK